MLFSSIRGHDPTLKLLRLALERGQLGHAYLFSGPEGVGKKRVAEEMAQALLCLRSPGQGCGTCRECLQVKAHTHPDFLVVALAPERKEISIEQVRELRQRLGLQAARGGKKVALMNDAHLLSLPAQSALLKVLEEPPGDALLILIVTNLSLLLPPLQSRCQHLRFAPLPLPLVAEVLVEDHGMDVGKAQALAAFSQGSVGRALGLHARIFVEERPQLLSQLAGIASASFLDLSRLAEQLGRGEGEVVARLEVLLSWYRDLVRYGLLGERGVEQNADCLPLVVRVGAQGGVEDFLRCWTLVYHTLQALGRGANRQLALERMLLGLAPQYREKVPMESILSG